MFVSRCHLTLHDTLFYATREMGRLYETGKYLHNYGLTYALGLVQTPYFHANQVPNYATHLEPLNQQGIYVTPAKPLHYDFVFHTFKRASVPYYTYQPQTTVNVPLYGRAKELATESTFEFFVFSKEPVTLPHWVRLGKWMSKAEVQATWQGEPTQKKGVFIANHPLNPLDVPGQLIVFDLISMPPVSLIRNARIEGPFYELPDSMKIPAGMAYTFPKA
jgi:CRISPR-associated protein Csc1